MRAWLAVRWESTRTSFWFVPLLMIGAAVGLSALSQTVDRSFPQMSKTAWIWSGDASGARALLSAIAESMMTVAGTVFSITMVVLQLASSQFGPRLLRNFMRDLVNQFVLGTFTATFLFCLLTLRSVRGGGGGEFIPSLSVTLGLLLAVASLLVLVLFIHHVARTIQAESISSALGKELVDDITRLYPLCLEEAVAAPDPPPLPGAAPALVRSTASGYLLAIARTQLLAKAEDHDWLIRLTLRPGDFVIRNDPLAEIWSRNGQDPDPGTVNGLSGAFDLGPRRTPTQDVRHCARQLAEMAARALSPGINDPFTAIGCIDWLADALAEMARRAPLPDALSDAGNCPRLLEVPVAFPGLLDVSFDPIRAYGANSIMVALHLLQTLARLTERVSRPEDRAALRRHVSRIGEDAARQIEDAHDRQQIAACVRGALTALSPAR